MVDKTFKQKLKAYKKGKLTGEALTAFEAELEAVRKYPGDLAESEQGSKQEIEVKRKRRILKVSKWKARLGNVVNIVGIIITIIIVSQVFTSIYYSLGEPNRSDVFRDIVDQTLIVTEPYGHLGMSSSNVNTFYTTDITRDMYKQIGKESKKVGELTVPFLFSFIGIPERDIRGGQNEPSFTYPGNENEGTSDWDRLEHTPEGTVVSAYVSFSELLTTTEVLDQFAAQDLEIIWLAVDTGIGSNYGDIIGFPLTPIWHEDDMIQDSYHEEKGLSSSSSHSPDYEVGDTDILHKQFIKTLDFLEVHEKKVKRISNGFNLNLKKRLKYIKANEMKHYGLVLTGPTKEVLKLKEEEIIDSLMIDEVDFWNWYSQ